MRHGATSPLTAALLGLILLAHEVIDLSAGIFKGRVAELFAG